MLIKKTIGGFKIKPFLKKKWFLILILFFLNSIFFTFLGIYVHKYGYTYLVKKFITYDNNYRTNVIKNFIKKPFIKVEKINLNINFKNLKKLNENRNIALEKQLLYPEYNENVNATIRYKNKSVPVRIKLKGGIVNFHLNDKWSFKVRARKSNLFGLKEFALMHAERRNYLLEWYARKLYAEEGLIYKEYKFVNLYINGEDKGIYVIDENFTEALSTRNNRREGIYVRFGSDINFYWFGSSLDTKNDRGDLFSTVEGCCGMDENLQSTNIDVLNQRINTNSKNQKIKNFNIAKRLLEDFRRNKKKPEEIFDLDLMAKGFALSDLLGSWHSMHWGNMRFYFDPITRKLEPILDDNYNETTSYPQEDRAIRIDDSYNHSLLHKRLFNSKIFLEKYISNLSRYSNPKFLINFNEKINKEFETNLSYIRKFKSAYFFPSHHIEANRIRIEKFLNPYQPLYFSLWDKNDREVKLKIGNTSNLPLKVKRIEVLDEKNQVSLVDLVAKQDFIDKLYLEPRFFRKPIDYKYLKFNINSDLKIKKITLHYDIFGLKKKFSKNLDYPITTKESDHVVFNNNLDTTSDFNFLEFLQNKILIRKGHFDVYNDLIIPKNKNLVIAAGAKINLLNGSKIITNSRIIAEGTADDPIQFYSSDNLGQCILVLNEKKQSVLKYVYFNNLSNCSDTNMELTGSVNFYKTQVTMENIYFVENIKGDDYLNIINSSFDLKNLFFENAYADALDIDYSEGKIKNVNFNGCKNDAIDLSNSSIKIKNFSAENIGDKALSIGENSYLKGENFVINKSFLGLAVKDQSEVNLKNLVISNSNIGLAAYIKKQEYNPSTIKIDKFSTTNNKKEFFFEEGSKVMINERVKEDSEVDVFVKIYPPEKIN